MQGWQSRSRKSQTASGVLTVAPGLRESAAACRLRKSKESVHITPFIELKRITATFRCSGLNSYKSLFLCAAEAKRSRPVVRATVPYQPIILIPGWSPWKRTLTSPHPLLHPPVTHEELNRTLNNPQQIPLLCTTSDQPSHRTGPLN